MTKLYCITGFLGAGKTTLLRNLIPLFSDKRVFLLINEFGKAGVDGQLLREQQVALAEINNGSIFCSCRLDRFEGALLDALAQAVDVILVEASGLADPTSICKVLTQPGYEEICYEGCICVADGVRLEKVITTARVCPKQIAVSSLVLLNKADLTSPAQLERDVRLIREISPTIAIRETRYGGFDPAWLSLVAPRTSAEGCEFGPDITLQKACVTVKDSMTPQQMRSFLLMLAEDTYRMKGFVSLQGESYLVDCVGPLIQLTPDSRGGVERMGTVVLLAGTGMSLRQGLKQALEWYRDYVTEEKP